MKILLVISVNLQIFEKDSSVRPVPSFQTNFTVSGAISSPFMLKEGDSISLIGHALKEDVDKFTESSLGNLEVTEVIMTLDDKDNNNIISPGVLAECNLGIVTLPKGTEEDWINRLTEIFKTHGFKD